MPDITFAIRRVGVIGGPLGLNDVVSALANTVNKYNYNFPNDDDVVARVTAKWHISVGAITFSNNPDAITLAETDLIFDKLRIEFPIDLPDVTAGGGWIDIPNPAGGIPISIQLPTVNVFTRDEDLVISVVLDGLRSEVQGAMNLNLVHFKFADSNLVDETAREIRRGLARQFVDAEPWIRDFFKLATKDGWELRLEPLWFDFDLVDSADINGDMVNHVGKQLIEFATGLPDDIRTAFESINGDLSEFLRALLDIDDDIETWILDNLTRLDVIRRILDIISERMGFMYLVKVADDPKFPVGEGIPPVAIAIDNARIRLTSEELLLDLNIGVPDF